jgi:hypothetical protein
MNFCFVPSQYRLQSGYVGWPLSRLNQYRSEKKMPLFLFVLLACILAAPAAPLAGDHAREEIAEFSRVRPEAGALLRSIPEVSEYLVRAFRGDFTSVPLDWNNEEPQGHAYAENTPNDSNTSILIRVSPALGPLDQVAALVYESRNAQNEKQFAAIIRDAYVGVLDKEQFIREILRLEQTKMKETRAFLAPIKPFSTLDPAPTEFYRKMLGTPEGFDDFITYLHRIKRPEYDVFDMYSKFYDFLTLTPQKRKEEMAAKEREAAAAAAIAKEGGAAVNPGEKTPASNMPATP